MNTNATTIESHLHIKSTAALREQIISELTVPDKSLMMLLQDAKDKDTDETKNESKVCD